MTPQEAQTIRNHNKLRTMSEDIRLMAVIKYDNAIEDKGDSWVDKSVKDSWFSSRLVQELGEFLEKPSIEEAADVLNFMSMVLARE